MYIDNVNVIYLDNVMCIMSLDNVNISDDIVIFLNDVKPMYLYNFNVISRDVVNVMCVKHLDNVNIMYIYVISMLYVHR